MQKMIREVASLNKMAVSCLQAGRYQDAIALLSKAMRFAHKTSAQDFESDMRHASESTMNSEVTSTSEVGPSMFSLPDVTRESCDNPFTVYARPFLIDDTAFVPMSVIHLTLTFNAGLVYQHRGLTKNCVADLKVASRYYERALGIVHLNAVEGFASNGMYWMTLALLTNKASLLWHFWDIEKAFACQKRLKMLLDGQESFSLPSEEGFFFECVVWQGEAFGERNVAPAA